MGKRSRLYCRHLLSYRQSLERRTDPSVSGQSGDSTGNCTGSPARSRVFSLRLRRSFPGPGCLFVESFDVAFHASRGEVYVADEENRVFRRLATHSPTAPWLAPLPLPDLVLIAPPRTLDTHTGVLTNPEGPIAYLGGIGGEFWLQSLTVPESVTSGLRVPNPLNCVKDPSRSREICSSKAEVCLQLRRPPGTPGKLWNSRGQCLSGEYLWSGNTHSPVRRTGWRRWKSWWGGTADYHVG